MDAHSPVDEQDLLSTRIELYCLPACLPAIPLAVIVASIPPAAGGMHAHVLAFLRLSRPLAACRERDQSVDVLDAGRHGDCCLRAALDSPTQPIGRLLAVAHLFQLKQVSPGRPQVLWLSDPTRIRSSRFQ